MENVNANVNANDLESSSRQARSLLMFGRQSSSDLLEESPNRRRASLLLTPPLSPGPSRTRRGGSKRHLVSGAMDRSRSNMVGKAIHGNGTVNGNLNVNDNASSTRNRLASALGQVPTSRTNE
jgi:hypothetical protein